MRWDYIVSGEFNKYVEESKGVCILPLGCVEHHAKHLPLGQDVFSYKLAEMAAEKERVVIFPPMYFGEKTGAGEFQGTIIFSNRLIFDILTESCREIARNGFKKIVIFTTHGGNINMAKNFVRSTLYEPHDYMVMHYHDSRTWPRPKDMLEIIDGGNRDYFPELTDEDIATLRVVDEKETVYGHGCFIETAVCLGLQPELVDLSKIGEVDGDNQNRLTHLALGGFYTPYGWMADYPNSYTCNWDKGNNERIGRSVVKYSVDKLAEAFKLIKEDTALDEYHTEWLAKQKLIAEGKWDELLK